MARPKITINDLPENWQDKVLELFSEGGSRVEAQVLLDISDSTFNRLIREDKVFSKTIKKGLRMCEAWWLKKGRTSLDKKEFSYVGWYMNMKNRFGWKDKHELSGDEKRPITIKGVKETLDKIYGSTGEPSQNS